MSAKIKLPDDIIDNTERKFGSETKYVFVKLEKDDGEDYPMMFTLHELEVALARAAKNPEDVPPVKSWLASLFGG